MPEWWLSRPSLVDLLLCLCLYFSEDHLLSVVLSYSPPFPKSQFWFLISISIFSILVYVFLFCHSLYNIEKQSCYWFLHSSPAHRFVICSTYVLEASLLRSCHFSYVSFSQKYNVLCIVEHTITMKCQTWVLLKLDCKTSWVIPDICS